MAAAEFSVMKGLAFVTNKLPCCSVLSYDHLGLSVSNIANSISFYEKIGFDSEKYSESSTTAIMRNRGGLQLQIFLCDKGIDDDKNILMDYPQQKYPGHTHASFSVPNTQSVKTYLESQGIAISGERKYPGNERLYAVFARDPDRSTLEFEKNFGDMDDVAVTRFDIGYPQLMDHVGIRVSNPVASWNYYAEMLGFNQIIKHYEPNPDPLKNFAPWITRSPTDSDHGCEINFIINANIPAEKENILLAGGIVRPGIVYVAFKVPDIVTAERNLRAAGAKITREDEVESSPRLASLKGKFLPSSPGQTSFFLEDEEFNLLRLVSA